MNRNYKALFIAALVVIAFAVVLPIYKNQLDGANEGRTEAMSGNEVNASSGVSQDLIRKREPLANSRVADDVTPSLEGPEPPKSSVRTPVRHTLVDIEISKGAPRLLSSSFQTYVSKRRSTFSGSDTHLFVLRDDQGAEIVRGGVNLDGRLYWDEPMDRDSVTADDPHSLTGGSLKQDVFFVNCRLPVGGRKVIQLDCYALPETRVRRGVLSDVDLSKLEQTWSMTINQ